MNEKIFNSTNIGLLIAFFALLVGAFPAYWSYLCRSQGVYCEGSIAGPQSISRNLEGVTERISTEAGRKTFQGLFVADGGFWPLTHRRDLVARFAGEPDVVIDTFPYGEGEATIYNNDREHIVAIVRTPTLGGGTSVSAYFPAANLAKRSFEIGCAYGHLKDKAVRVSNFAYLPESRRVIIDVSSPCEDLSLSTGQSFDLRRSLFRSTSLDRAPYGATVAISFSTTLHVVSAHAVHLEERRKEALRDVNVCKEHYQILSDRVEGDLWPCMSNQSEDLSSPRRQLEIYRNSMNELKLVGHDNCNMPFWHLGRDRRAVFVTCDQETLDKAKSDVWLSEYRSVSTGVSEATHFMKGNCDHLAGYDFEDSSDGSSLDFRLETNCAEVDVDGKNFSIPLMPGTVRTVAMYRLFRDRHGVVVGLSPLELHTTSATSSASP